jgi:uncharacterized SAM-binding protein YcdF (DUF218 family)
MKGGKRFLLFSLVLLLCAAGLSLFAFRHLGQWLELDEPLRQSTAIAVLGGGVPFRAMEAAKLYHAGWAKEIWLTEGKSDARDRALAAIGLDAGSEHESSRIVLEKLEVPHAAIQLIPGPVDNTVSELQTILDYARKRQLGPVILVSSKSHTRRLRVIWNRVASKDREAIVRGSSVDTFDAAAWWRTTSDALEAFREAFGIANALAGFPMAPRER